MAWHFDVASHIGARSEQQDRAVVLTAPGGAAQLAVLADGLGGHGQGAAAAQTVIDCARRRLNEAPVTDPQQFLTDLCRRSHEAIARLGRRRRTNPASTCVLLYVREKEAYWVHVGDSRLYHFRGDRLLSRTRDHTLAEIRTATEAGQLSLPPSGVDGHRLYMCLGGKNDLSPEFGASAVEDDDWFVLCSDGFWNQVAPEETSRAFLESARERTTAAELATLASRRAGSGGDNVSLVLAAHGPGPIAGTLRQFGRLLSAVRVR